MWQDIVSANHLIINTAHVGSCSEDIGVMSAAEEKQYVSTSEQHAALAKSPGPQKHDKSTKGHELIARKGNHGRGWGWGIKKKNLSSFVSQQTAGGVPARQFHWAREVEHCSVSDLHSVYYAITEAPRPRGGLLNPNMRGAALFSLSAELFLCCLALPPNYTS